MTGASNLSTSPSLNTTRTAPRRRRNRKFRYRHPHLVALLFTCWVERERMCAKRLVVQLPHWLHEHEAVHGPVEESLRRLLLSISPASIDRALMIRRATWYASQGTDFSSTDGHSITFPLRERA